MGKRKSAKKSRGKILTKKQTLELSRDIQKHYRDNKLDILDSLNSTLEKKLHMQNETAVIILEGIVSNTKLYDNLLNTFVTLMEDIVSSDNQIESMGTPRRYKLIY